MYKVGIIGCGGMGGHHATAVGALDHAAVVAVYDADAERAAALAERVGATAAATVEAVLDTVDAVFLCTPPSTRLDLIQTCAGAGKHIFCEKPLALDLATGTELCRIVADSGITFMVNYVLRFTEPYRLAHRLFAEGRLGRLVNVYMRRYMPVDFSQRWFGQQELSGGALLDFGSHDLDMLRWFGGPAHTVFGRVDRVRPGMNADDHAQSLVAFATGMGASDISWWAPGRTNTFGVVGSKGSIIVDQPETIRLHLDGEDEVVLDAAALAAEAAAAPRTGAGAAEPDPCETVQQHFFRCLEEGREPLNSVTEAHATLALVLAIQQAAESGQAVSL